MELISKALFEQLPPQSFIANLGPPSLLLHAKELLIEKEIEIFNFELFPEDSFMKQWRGDIMFIRDKIKKSFDGYERIYTFKADFAQSLAYMQIHLRKTLQEITESGLFIVADTCNVKDLGQVDSRGTWGFYRELEELKRCSSDKTLAMLNTYEKRVPGTARKYAQCYFDKPVLHSSVEYKARGVKGVPRLLTFWKSENSMY
jgi:hypothetical protein